MRISIDRLMQSLEDMWQFGATPNGGVTRMALSDEDRDARNLLRTWCEDAGMTVHIDDFGNMIARRAGSADLPPVIMGSHSDTVPQGGRYDGILGILTGLEVVRSLNDLGIETTRPIDVVNWTAEEGSRFRPSLFGSKGALGIQDSATALAAVDAAGVCFGDELVRIGYAGDAANRPTKAFAYLELHIEQGPVLEAENIPVGLVEGIIGQTWFDVTVTGRPGHAGANPMHLRSDALVAAAIMVQEIRRLALAGKDYSVATVGQMTVSPGAMNVIPSSVQFTIDLRCANATDIAAIEAGIREAGHAVEEAEGVSVEMVGSDSVHASTPFNTDVMGAIRAAIVAENLPVREMWSGAGHDAGMTALHWPTGMIFVRSKDGLSHAEAEYSSPEDIAAATSVLLRTVETLANSPT